MRPDRGRANRPQQGKARARILLKRNAGWLPGFPTVTEPGAVHWQGWPWESPGEPRRFTIDREALRRVEMTLSKLLHRFPHALPKIVEDVDDWQARMTRLLEAAKGAVHDDCPIDVPALLRTYPSNRRWGDRFLELRATRPEATQLVDAVAMVAFSGRRRLDMQAFDWVDEHASRLLKLVIGDEHQLALQLTFSTLRDDVDADTLRFLMDLMASEAFCSAASGNAYTYVDQLAGQLKKCVSGQSFIIPSQPCQETLGDLLRRLLNHLLTCRPKTRRDVGNLLSALLPLDLAEKAGTLQADVEEQETQLHRLLLKAQYQRGDLSGVMPTAKRLAESVDANRKSDETAALMANVAFLLKHAAAIVGEQRRFPWWRGFLACLPPEAQTFRLGLFRNWEDYRAGLHRWQPQVEDDFDRRLRIILCEMDRLFSRRGVSQVIVKQWRALLGVAGRRRDDFVASLAEDDDLNKDHCRSIVKLLEMIVYDRGLEIGPRLLCSLGEFVQATPDLGWACRMIANLVGGPDCHHFQTEISAAMAVSQDGAEAAAILKALDENYHIDGSVVALLGSNLPDERLRRIVQQCILAGDNETLKRLATSVQLVLNVGLSPPTLPANDASSDWIDRYPQELHEVLQTLHASTPRAEDIASGLLRKDLPDPSALRKEVAAIQSKLSVADFEPEAPSREHLRRRAENLENWIDKPPCVSPRRLENLATKIAHRVDRELVERYIDACYAVAMPVLQAETWPRGLVEQLLAPPRDRLLAGIMQLSEPTRDLAIRILLKSCEAPQCDFREEPENVRFLKTLEAKGIRVEPWLNDSFALAGKTATGERYRLAFTRDIVDVLLMGHHFSTCLSPGAINFFSTVANAIDINKQVVYGKTKSGRIVGRCLFAISDQGKLLSYHRYAHYAGDDFEEQINRFQVELARAMNTTLAQSGNVSSLVARRWYDDGPVGLAAAYDIQNPNGSIRMVLRTENVSTLIESLTKLVGSHETLRSCLELLLWLDEIKEREEIVLPLVNAFAFDRSVPFPQRFRLAMLAQQAGEGEIARRVVDRLGANATIARLRRLEWHNSSGYGAFEGVGDYREVLELLIEYSPTFALRLLRQTRPKGIRSDAEETVSLRKDLLADCHTLLGRPSTSAAQ